MITQNIDFHVGYTKACLFLKVKNLWSASSVGISCYLRGNDMPPLCSILSVGVMFAISPLSRWEFLLSEHLIPAMKQDSSHIPSTSCNNIKSPWARRIDLHRFEGSVSFEGEWNGTWHGIPSISYIMDGKEGWSPYVIVDSLSLAWVPRQKFLQISWGIMYGAIKSP